MSRSPTTRRRRSPARPCISAAHTQGGSSETLNGASLIYRYKIEFPDVTTLTSVAVTGVAFNEPNSILRVLDENRNVLATANTRGGNVLRTFTVLLENVRGRVFYIDEFDTSSHWRYRKEILVNGVAALGNGEDGIGMWNQPKGNRIGTDANGVNDDVERNVISGNWVHGIAMSGASSENVIAGNYIGTDASGTLAVPNRSVGVLLRDRSSNNVIGGTVAAAGNVISGNRWNGVDIANSGTNGNMVAGNLIGTDKTGTVALANQWDGVVIYDGASNNTIGGDTPEARNVIAANGWDGVEIFGAGTTGNVVAGNYIGTDITGTVMMGNLQVGVAFWGGASNNTVGGVTEGARNIISANGNLGVGLWNSGTSHNVIEGNYIGTDVTGTVDFGNRWTGVVIGDNASNNTVGGVIAGAGNVISGNGGHGVDIASPGSTGNVVAGNLIGLDKTGTAALGNAWDGIAIHAGASNNTVGGNTRAARNVISANNQGIEICDPGTNGNLVTGNFIGTDISGMVALGNSGTGINIWGGPANNTIGGTTDAARNVVSGNGWCGIAVTGSGSNGNLVAGNLHRRRRNRRKLAGKSARRRHHCRRHRQQHHRRNGPGSGERHLCQRLVRRERV